MTPRSGARLACTIIALAAAGIARAEAPVSPQRHAVLEERARKAIAARSTGRWIVAPGEHLRLIARQFFPDDRKRERRLADAIAHANPGAFVHGDRDRLVPGARLVIPADALGAPASTPPIAAPATIVPDAPAPSAKAARSEASQVTAVPAPEFA